MSQKESYESETVTPVLKDIEVLVVKVFQFLSGAISRLFSFVAKSIGLTITHYRWTAALVLIGGTLGLSGGFFMNKKYQSTAIISNPIATSNQLYADINYLNSLVENKNFDRLGTLLELSSDEARKLISFEVEPQVNVINLARSVDNLYSSIDTTIWNAVSQDFFENNEDPNLFGSHLITIRSLDPTLYEKIDAPLMKFLEDHDQLQIERERIYTIWSARRDRLVKKINKLDSLQDVYTGILVAESKREQRNGSTQINLANAESQTVDPIRLVEESEKYQNLLLNLERKLVYFDNYYWVVARLNPNGENASLSRRNMSLIGAGIGYLACLIFLLSRYKERT